jgi:hypothetical protein
MRTYMWMIDGSFAGLLRAESGDEAHKRVLAQRAGDYAALAGRTEPNDEDREKAKEKHERADEIWDITDDLAAL